MAERGFSLVEALVALFLSTSISLALLKQQWQISRLHIQIQQQCITWLQIHNRTEQGFSILECLLGLTLLLGLMSMLMQEYVQIKQQIELNRHHLQQLSRMHTLLTMLESSGHQAGFTPCLSIRQLQSFDHRSGQSLQALNIENTKTCKLILQRMKHFVPVRSHSVANQFTLLDHWRAKPQVPVMIADCQHAEVLDQYQIQSQSMQFLQKLKYHYQSPIYIGEWLTESFWVNSNVSGKPVLFYQSHQQPEELWTDVQSIQGWVDNTRSKRILHLNIDLGKGPIMTYLIRLYHA